jgi:hypothetical protein
MVNPILQRKGFELYPCHDANTASSELERVGIDLSGSVSNHSNTAGRLL